MVSQTKSQSQEFAARPACTSAPLAAAPKSLLQQKCKSTAATVAPAPALAEPAESDVAAASTVEQENIVPVDQDVSGSAEADAASASETTDTTDQNTPKGLAGGAEQQQEQELPIPPQDHHAADAKCDEQSCCSSAADLDVANLDSCAVQVSELDVSGHRGGRAAQPAIIQALAKQERVDNFAAARVLGRRRGGFALPDTQNSVEFRMKFHRDIQLWERNFDGHGVTGQDHSPATARSGRARVAWGRGAAKAKTLTGNVSDAFKQTSRRARLVAKLRKFKRAVYRGFFESVDTSTNHITIGNRAG